MGAHIPPAVQKSRARLSWPPAHQQRGRGGSEERALPSSSAPPAAVSPWTLWTPAPASPWLRPPDDPPVSAWLRAGRGERWEEGEERNRCSSYMKCITAEAAMREEMRKTSLSFLLMTSLWSSKREGRDGWNENWVSDRMKKKTHKKKKRC